MRHHGRKHGMLMIAAASALAFALPAFGQQRVGSDGHALDANNRVGSGGYNTASGEQRNITPNEIIYGNVTGGRAFTGPVGSTDARAFRGPTAGNGTDRFVRDSSGAPAPYTPDAGIMQPQPYYGMSRGVAPPPGYVQEGFSGGFIKADMTPGRTSGDVRLGNPFIGVENVPLPGPGDMVLSGPISNQTDNSLITASPLYGIRQWGGGNPNEQYNYQNFTALGPAQAEAGGPAKAPANAEPAPTPTDQARPQPLPNAPLEPIGPDGRNLSQPPLSNDVADGSGQGYQTLTPQERTPQYQRMHQRLEQFYKQQNLGDAEARRLADQQMRLRQKAHGQSPAGSGLEPAEPSTPATPNPSKSRPNERPQGRTPGRLPVAPGESTLGQ